MSETTRKQLATPTMTTQTIATAPNRQNQDPGDFAKFFKKMTLYVAKMYSIFRSMLTSFSILKDVTLPFGLRAKRLGPAPNRRKYKYVFSTPIIHSLKHRYADLSGTRVRTSTSIVVNYWCTEKNVYYIKKTSAEGARFV